MRILRVAARGRQLLRAVKRAPFDASWERFILTYLPLLHCSELYSADVVDIVLD
jgi:hypothetical protein